MSQSGYSSAQPLAVLIAMLKGSVATPHHSLWNDEISLLDAAVFHQQHMHSPNQLTDLYLLALAVQHGERLVSFDQRIPLSAVRGATAQHLVIL
jgi:predicted nucleic acid-binding protein